MWKRKLLATTEYDLQKYRVFRKDGPISISNRVYLLKRLVEFQYQRHQSTTSLLTLLEDVTSIYTSTAKSFGSFCQILTAEKVAI